MPGHVVRTAGCTLPMRVRIGTGRLTQGIPLRKPTSFGVAPLLLLDLRKKQIETTLVESLGKRRFNLAACVRDQAGIQSRSRQKQSTLRVGLIALCQQLGGLIACSLVRFWSEGKFRQVWMRRAPPGFSHDGAGAAFVAIDAQAPRVGENSGRER